MTDHVQNPITKRFIKTDGVLYKKLQSQGIKFEKPKLINSNFSVDRANTPWGKKKPHKIGERRELLEKCGKDAFLLPDKLKFTKCFILINVSKHTVFTVLSIDTSPIMIL